MDRNFRRMLYTALVAGGLVVVGASSAHAAGDGLPDPARAAAAGGTAAVRGDLGTPAESREPEATVAGQAASSAGAGGVAEELTGADLDADGGLVGDVLGPDGILGSVAKGDVVGVVDGALGEDGLVDDLLGGLPQVPGPEEPGTEEPGTDEPGTDGPGTDEPGTDEPGTDPGTDGPGTGEPGTGEPGTDGPGTDEPGTDEPGTGKPGTDEPGTGKPGTGRPGAGRPGTHDPEPGSGTDRPGADSGTDGTGSDKGHEVEPPGAERPGRVSLTDAVADGPEHVRDLGLTSPSADFVSLDLPATGQAQGATEDTAENTTGAGSDADGGSSAGGVDIGWGDTRGVVPNDHHGGILSGGLSEGLNATVIEPEPAGETEAEPVMVPGDTPVQAGHMFTGQLSLISLLLGLGIAVLRVRRR